MQRRIVEVLPAHPDDQAVIGPVHERHLDLADPRESCPMGVWEALYIFACGDSEALALVLAQDDGARNLLLSFEEHWFVRAEQAQDNACEARVESLGEAVSMARVIRNRARGKDVLTEILGDPDY